MNYSNRFRRNRTSNTSFEDKISNHDVEKFNLIFQKAIQVNREINQLLYCGFCLSRQNRISKSVYVRLDLPGFVRLDLFGSKSPSFVRLDSLQTGFPEKMRRFCRFFPLILVSA